ncbi:MAG: acylphosphatase [Phycisphaeraceae bacterium]|nr:MAG: acylphosphatase [Phycisphaeraceae bacterium]
MQRREIRYTGRVQGVGFRATARAVARRYDVTGWVRNEPDGSVRMHVQGEPAEIDRCLGELAEVMSRYIDHAASHEAAVVEGDAVFEIRH